MQAQDIYDSYARYKRDVADVGSEVFLEWVQFMVRFVYDKAKRVDAERFVQEKSYAITTNPQTFALESNFQDLNQTACGLYYYDTDSSESTDKKLGLTGYGHTDEGYYLSGSNVIFTGIEDSTYVMRYIAVPPTIDDLDDYITLDALITGAPILEDRHLEYTNKAIDVLYEQWDNDPTKESIADFRFVRALDGVLDGYNRTPQVSIMKNPISNF